METSLTYNGGRGFYYEKNYIIIYDYGFVSLRNGDGGKFVF